MIVTLFIVLALLLLLTVPVFVALSFTSLISFSAFSDMNLMVIVQRMLGGIDKFSLMSVPFFILGANVMKNGGIATRILNWAQDFVGHLKGGMAVSTEVACDSCKKASALRSAS